MDSIRVSEAPDPGSIPGEATTPLSCEIFWAESALISNQLADFHFKVTQTIPNHSGSNSGSTF